MKIGSTLEINFAGINTLDAFYDLMSKTFSFPDFFGRNINALIDCLFSLRFPEDGMTSIHVLRDEYLLLILINFSSVPNEIKEILVVAIEEVSYKLNEKEQQPSIVILLK